MAPTYKLTYFNTPGVAEPIRYLLSYGNVNFEDVRVEKSDWPKVKPTLKNNPYGKLPILEIDGKTVHQSVAICRYLAKQFKLTGKNDWDSLEADIVVDTLNDLKLACMPFFRAEDEQTKMKELEQIKTVHNPFYLPKLEEKAKKNGGHFVNGQLTWADIYFAAFAVATEAVAGEGAWSEYPTLKALKDKVVALPGIKAYREKQAAKK